MFPLLMLLAAPPMVVVNERDVVRQEAPPHGAIGMSTAYRISDGVPNRAMEFRKRVLHRGAAIGLVAVGFLAGAATIGDRSSPSAIAVATDTGARAASPANSGRSGAD